MKLRFFRLCTAVLAIAVGESAAQTKDTKSAPVEVKRVPPSKPSPKESVPNVDKYPFGQLIQTLGPDPAAAPSLPSSSAPAIVPPSDVPADFRPSKDITLPSAAQSALNVAKGWMTEKQAPAPGADGRVLYTYGSGMPTVVCAPMRVCVVELETGERLSGEPRLPNPLARREAIRPMPLTPPSRLRTTSSCSYQLASFTLSSSRTSGLPAQSCLSGVIRSPHAYRIGRHEVRCIAPARKGRVPGQSSPRSRACN